ncbi:MAG: hypothetical protein U0X73_06105 [Thermoanaerobaculia bacterium]
MRGTSANLAGALAAGLAFAFQACSPALRPPRPIAELGRPSTGAAPAPERSAEELLAAAESEFLRRPDRAAVDAAVDAALAAALADPTRADGLVVAARALAWRVEHESAAGARAALVARELEAAQWCGKRAPSDPRCDYALAIALGQQARERPSTAEDGLRQMVAALRRAAAAAPELDRGGPDRVLALVLLRAPGWPAGPGDPEAGLAAARRAVAIDPDHAPNQLAFAEALRKNDAETAAHTAFARARQLAAERERAGDPDATEWVREADRALGPG